MALRALVLDFGGVISRTFFETHAESEKALGLPAGTLNWRGPFDPAGDLLWQAMQADQISERDYWLARTQEVGALLGEQWEQMETLIRRTRGAQPDAIVRPQARNAILVAKRAGVRLAILSNELDLFYGTDLRARLPLLAEFDAIVDATYTGILKPDPRAYEGVCQALQLSAAECVFIDDQARNVLGARRYGMAAIELDVRNPGAAFTAALLALGMPAQPPSA